MAICDIITKLDYDANGLHYLRLLLSLTLTVA